MKRQLPKYIAALLLFGSNGVFAAGIDLASSEIVFFRAFLGCLLLAAVFLLSRQRPTLHLHRKDALFVSLSGVALAANWLFLYEAYQRIGVGLATVLDYCGPIIVMALAPLAFGERLTRAKVGGFFVVAAGFALMNANFADGGMDGWGLACGILAAVMYAVMVSFSKKSGGAYGLEGVVLQMAACLATVAVYVGATRGFGFVASIPFDAWPAIFVLGAVNTGVGCYLYFSSIGGLPVQTVAVCGYLEPLAAVAFSAVLLGETLQAMQVAGAALILGGALFAESADAPKGRRKHAHRMPERPCGIAAEQRAAIARPNAR